MQDADLIIEVWSRIKPLIPVKDRLDAADGLVDVFDDYGMADGLEDMKETLDAQLSAAVKSRYGLDSIEEDDYEDQY